MNPSEPGCLILSGRARVRLGALQGRVEELCARRGAALRLLFASRHAATCPAQRDFWLQFSGADREYRLAVRRLAQFCAERREGSRRAWRAPWRTPARSAPKDRWPG